MKYYFIGINIFTFIIFGFDKLFAIKNKTRISEKILFFLSLIGGCYFELLGMFVFRHKTKKIKFYIFNFAFTFIYIYIYIIYKYYY